MSSSTAGTKAEEFDERKNNWAQVETKKLVQEILGQMGLYIYMYIYMNQNKLYELYDTYGCFLKYRCQASVAWEEWFGGMIWGMFLRYDSGYDSPDASKHGFKTMGMIRGRIRGYVLETLI